MRRRYEVHWSPESVLRTDNIVQYLEENWSEKEAINFLMALQRFEEIVSRFPEIYPASDLNVGTRRAVVMKQVSVFYSVSGKVVEIHSLFDNRENPDKLRR